MVRNKINVISNNDSISCIQISEVEFPGYAMFATNGKACWSIPKTVSKLVKSCVEKCSRQYNHA